MKKKVFLFVTLFLAALLAFNCVGGPKTAQTTPKMDTVPLTLSLLHVNDTHAKLEPVYTELKADIDENLKGKRTFVELGGFARLWTAVDALRAQNPNMLFVHAGDVFQGTLYFTQFAGKADLDFLNSMKLDAMTLGNHEFDKGPAILADFAKDAKFPILSCNIDVSAEPSLKSIIKPYVIKEIGGAKVALIGIITPDTPFISSPGKNIKFLDPVESLTKVVKELEAQGINKIVVLSHSGYDSDKEIAAKVAGIDVIIGGHSHSLIGSLGDLGIKSLGDYPTVVKNSGGETLVVTSWQWANAIGVLDVDFDATGKIVSFKGSPRLLAGNSKFRIYDLPDADGKMKRVEFIRDANNAVSVKEYDGKAYAVEPSASARATYLAALEKLTNKYGADPRFIFAADKPEGTAKLAEYSKSVIALQKKIATNAVEDLKRANNKGPGPLIADSMIAKTGADIAIMNPGGVRVDLAQGDVSVAQVYELQPFANTLMTINLTGAEVVKVIEDMTDFQISTSGKDENKAYVYVSNLRLTLNVNGPSLARVADAQVKGKDGAWKPIDPAATYKVVVNNFMGTGGDKNTTLEKLDPARRYDTGYIDSEAMLDFVRGKAFKNPTEELVKNVL